MEASTLNVSEIDSWEIINPQAVYDLTVSENSNYYLANQNDKILVHNSGKSVFSSQKVIIRVLTEEKHRILCARKISATLRESVYKRLKNEISAMGFMHEFNINQTEMRFTHLPTGNEILLTGLDDVEKLKSIEGITSIWIEEATELNEGDLDQLDLRLRGETKNYKQIILSFNPIDESHWIKKRFFDNVQPNAFVLRTTFDDNAFLDEEYRAVLEQKASVNPNMYRIYYLGQWGREEVERPFASNFKVDKHVSHEIAYNPKLPIYFSWDFNVEPFVVELAHIWIDKDNEHVHIFDEMVIEKNGSVPDMCDLIESKYGRNALAMALFTGDAMQRKREITQKNNIDAWRIIDTRFQLGRRLGLPKANPRVAETRHLVNILLAFHPDLKVHPQCKKLIYDLQYCEVDENGEPLKKNRSDEKQRYDALDCFRYLCNSYLRGYLTKYNIKK